MVHIHFPRPQPPHEPEAFCPDTIRRRPIPETSNPETWIVNETWVSDPVPGVTSPLIKQAKPRAYGSELICRSSGLRLWLLLRVSTQGGSFLIHSPVEQYIYLYMDNPVPNCPNSSAPMHARIPSIQ